MTCGREMNTLQKLAKIGSLDHDFSCKKQCRALCRSVTWRSATGRLSMMDWLCKPVEVLEDREAGYRDSYLMRLWSIEMYPRAISIFPFLPGLGSLHFRTLPLEILPGLWNQSGKRHLSGSKSNNVVAQRVFISLPRNL
jgi:hypothetical protein